MLEAVQTSDLDVPLELAPGFLGDSKERETFEVARLLAAAAEPKRARGSFGTAPIVSWPAQEILGRAYRRLHEAFHHKMLMGGFVVTAFVGPARPLASLKGARLTVLTKEQIAFLTPPWAAGHRFEIGDLVVDRVVVRPSDATARGGRPGLAWQIIAEAERRRAAGENAPTNKVEANILLTLWKNHDERDRSRPLPSARTIENHLGRLSSGQAD